jgi:hypothetical protein
MPPRSLDGKIVARVHSPADSGRVSPRESSPMAETRSETLREFTAGTAARTHLETFLDDANNSLRHRRLESRLNPQAGKPAPRSADILVGGFWGLSSSQVRTVPRCAPAALPGKNPLAPRACLRGSYSLL